MPDYKEVIYILIATGTLLMINGVMMILEGLAYGKMPDM